MRGRTSVNDKAAQKLRSSLSDEQWNELVRTGWLTVRGSLGGKYMIHWRRIVYSVPEVWPGPCYGFCIGFKPELEMLGTTYGYPPPAEDLMLALSLLLRTDEQHFLWIARKFPPQILHKRYFTDNDFKGVF